MAPEDVYAQFKLTPKEMKSLIRLARDVAASLAVAKGVGLKREIREEIQDREECARETPKQLLEVLAKLSPWVEPLG